MGASSFAIMSRFTASYEHGVVAVGQTPNAGRADLANIWNAAVGQVVKRTRDTEMDLIDQHF